MKKKSIDIHTKNAAKVARFKHFVITDISHNQNIGLLVGTAVKKIGNPEPRDSHYWDGSYWTALFEAPNGETRRICCDAVAPANEDVFRRQRKSFDCLREVLN